MDQQDIQNSQVQTLKNILTQILHKNTAYDSLPINSSINSIDKNVSLYDAINLLICKHLEQLLIWDPQQSRWIWMLTLVDAIRFIIHALKSLLRRGVIDFTDFQKERNQQQGQMISIISQCTKQQLEQVTSRLQQKSIEQIIVQITQKSPVKDYIRLKSMSKHTKLQMLIVTMRLQKIHRIIIEDSDTNMFISVINFKDIFLYIMRIANQSPITFNYGSIGINALMQAGQYKNIEINWRRPLWQAFEIMTDRDKSLWINVVDEARKFKGMLFREDFREIFQGWHVDYLWMTVGDFILWKSKSVTTQIPQFRYFQPSQSTRDILWKMIMSRRNAIVWVDGQQKIKATIGLMQIFRLYIS